MNLSDRKMKLSAILLCLVVAGLIITDGVDSFTAPSSQTYEIRKHRNSNPFLLAASSTEAEDEDESFNSLDDIHSKHLGRKTMLDAIGFTAYGSRMIYEIAGLRRLVETHSRCVREEFYQGKPAKKKLFGVVPWGEEKVVKFNGPEKIFSQLGSFDGTRQPCAKTGLLKHNITADEVADFIGSNIGQIGLGKDGSLVLEEDSEPASNKQKGGLYQTLNKLKGENIRIVAFDDQFQDSELIYAIAINDSQKRVSLVFRGSVVGNQDWPTNLKWDQISVNELVSEFKSEFITKDDAKKVSDVKLHRGFSDYLFAPLATHEGELKLYHRYWSKFDKIVSMLKKIYDETDETGALKHADYQLCLSGHSLGGALAQLMAFALGSSDKCRQIFPMPILAVTYASPCVGNEAFSKAMFKYQEKNIVHHVRITNEGDIVPVVFSLSVFNGYTQSGCNFHVRDQAMELGGFNNTQTFCSEMNVNALNYHSMESHMLRLFFKVDGKNVNGKVWRRHLEDSFISVKEGKDLSLIPDARPYRDRYKIELKDELTARGLKVSGTRAELVERLEASDKRDMAEA